MNTPCTNTGISPLQVAIKNGNLRTIQSLLTLKPSLEHLDYEANSVYHYAANTTKEIISVSNITLNFIKGNCSYDERYGIIIINYKA